jgi:hypothetical protein
MATTRVGDEEPGTQAPRGRARVLVRRGFAAWARALQERAGELLAAETDLCARAALLGAQHCVGRVYSGGASDGTPDLAADLAHAERVLADVAAGRPALARAEGFVPLAVEAGAGQPRPVGLRLRLPAPPADAAAPRPPSTLVLFLVGAPTWDGAWSRPVSVREMAPGWLARALLASGFDAERRFACAVLGAGEVTADVVVRAVAAIAAATPIDPARVVLVGEREGAATMLACARAGCLPEAPRGVVCVAGGALSPGGNDFLARTALLLVPARGHASEENLRRAAAFAAADGYGERVETAAERRAWPWALPCALPAIERFCRDVVR